MKRSSFTLIEIMVVISILGILATIVIIGSRKAIIFARDSVRKSTLATLERAIAQYAAEEGEDHYPLSNENATLELLETSSPTGIKLLSGNYLKTIPLNLSSTDQDNQFYSYLTTPSADKFFLGVPLEGKERTYFAYQPNGTKEQVSSSDLPILHSSQSGLAVTQESSGTITVFFNSAKLPKISGSISPIIYRIIYQLASGEWQKSAYSGNTAITLNNLASGTYSLRLQAYDLAGNVSAGPTQTFQTNQSVITPGTPNQPSLSADSYLVSATFNSVNNAVKYVVEYKRSNWANWNRQVVTASPAQLLLESGVWSVRIGAISQSGKIVYGGERQITIQGSSDSQAPQFDSTPQAALQKTGANSFSLTWPTATDNSSWVNYSYELRLVGDNSLIASASNISTNTTNATGSIEDGAQYRLRIIAYDKSANTALFETTLTAVSQPAFHDCDLNKDGLVGPAHITNDYNALIACFLKSTNQYPECDWVDLNRDGLVDILDFGRFAYTYPNPPCHLHWP